MAPVDPATSPGAAPTEASAIDADVPCVGCGYNLRGLAPSGLCPECGHEVAPSVLHYEQRLAPLPPPDPAWARQLVEGAWLSLLSLAVLLLLCVLPGRMQYLPRRDAPLSETPGRVALLCVACAAWVLAWYSAWKITSPPPRDDKLAPRRRAAWARWTLTGYFLIPVVAALTPGYEKNPPPGPALYLLLGVPVGSVLLWATVAGLLRRIGRGPAATLAAFLALADCAALVLSAPLASVSSHHYRVGSLDLMSDLQPLPYAAPATVRYVLLAALDGDVGGDWVLFVVAGPLSAATLGVLAVRMRPFGRGGPKRANDLVDLDRPAG